MSTRRTGTPIAADSGIFSPVQARPGPARQAELAELEHTLQAAITSTLAEAASPITIASAQRGDQYSAVVLGGSVDASVIRALGAHLRGLLDGGSRHLVVALYRAAFERAHPPELSWAAVRCPRGLDEVAEPRTAARRRAIIDTGAGRAPGQAWWRPRSAGAPPPAGHGG